MPSSWPKCTPPPAGTPCAAIFASACSTDAWLWLATITSHATGAAAAAPAPPPRAAAISSIRSETQAS